MCGVFDALRKADEEAEEAGSDGCSSANSAETLANVLEMVRQHKVCVCKYVHKCGVWRVVCVYIYKHAVWRVVCVLIYTNVPCGVLCVRACVRDGGIVCERKL
jgi:hypothetical protein